MKPTHLLAYISILSIGLSLASLPSSHAHAASGTEPYVGFHKQTTAADFSGSSLSGIVVGSDARGADVHLASTGLSTGNNKKLYGAKKGYYYGTLESPVFDAMHPFDTGIASWDAVTPDGTWIQVELRAYRPEDDHWTKYYNMGIWASGTGTIERHSVADQQDADGTVATDTLLLYGDPMYTRYQYRLTLFTQDLHASPSVNLVSVMTSNSYKEPDGLDITSDHQAWGVDLNVPQRSQMIYKKGGEVWCSPTTTSMILAYWGFSVPVPQAADSTYDYTYQGNGNWPFNTAWASTYGLQAYITRMSSMSQIEEWISAGIPVAISFGFNAGELDGAPITSSGGHIMLVRGFDKDGNVIVNDPAASSDDGVRIVYKRDQLERLWLQHSGGTVYLIYPRGHATPTDKSNGSW